MIKEYGNRIWFSRGKERWEAFPEPPPPFQEPESPLEENGRQLRTDRGFGVTLARLHELIGNMLREHPELAATEVVAATPLPEPMSPVAAVEYRKDEEAVVLWPILIG